jgi:cystathionine beta-lyase/cystathionine gamma-synthase
MASDRWPRPQDPRESGPADGADRYDDDRFFNGSYADPRYRGQRYADEQYGQSPPGAGRPRPFGADIPGGSSQGGEYRQAVIRGSGDDRVERSWSPRAVDPWQLGPRTATDPPPSADGHYATDPRLADPRLADPRLADPRLADSRLDPRLADPRFADPRMPDRRMPDPRVADRRLADPRLADPRLADPRPADPSFADPRPADPRVQTEMRLAARRPPRAIEAPRLAIEAASQPDGAQPGAGEAPRPNFVPRLSSDPVDYPRQNAHPRPPAAQPRRYGENTRSVHLPVLPPPRQPPLATPIYRTTSFTFGSSAEYASILADATPGYSYSRIDNPTVEAFCAAIAALEGVNLSYQPIAQAFASGMAAISTVFWTFARAGAHVIAPSAMYGGSYSFLRNVASNFGVQTDFVDMTDLEGARAALRPSTAVVYAETLANPTVAVADIAGLARLAHEAGAILVVDSTLAPPVICRPLEHGADLVLHSATKYFGGHADVTGGVVTGHPELIRKIREVRIDTGGSLGPDDSYLLRRGLETLPLRVRRQCATALLLAAGLARHPAVRTVYYPGLTHHPGHALARRQFDAGPEGTRFGSIVTVAPHGGQEAGMMFADRLSLARLATSLGGTYTKVSHVGSTTHRQMDGAALAAAGIDPGSVRFSVGLEDGEDLLTDAIGALDSLGRR